MESAYKKSEALLSNYKQLDGKRRHFHSMPCGARNILSVTAGILRNLYERLYS